MCCGGRGTFSKPDLGRGQSSVPGRAASAIKTIAKKRSDHVIALLCAQPGMATPLHANRCDVRRDVSFFRCEGGPITDRVIMLPRLIELIGNVVHSHRLTS